MAVEREIERLLVRLRGDGKHYENMLKTARSRTQQYTRDIDGRLRDAQGKFVTGQRAMAYELSQTNSRLQRAAIRLQYLGARLTAVGAKARRFGQGMRQIGRSMSLYVTAPLMIAGTLATRSFAQFDQAMTESTSIMAVTEKQMEAMRRAAIGLSWRGEVLQAPKELGKAYFYLASAGKNAEQSMALLPKVSAFATAGAFDMALATDLLTDAQSALGLTSKNVARDTMNLVRVSDVLVKANTLANASVQQFSTALTSKAGAALKAFNKDIEEGVAILAAMADQGIKAELAGNSLDRMIRLLSKSSIDAAKAHEFLGFKVFDTSGQMRNLGDIVANLEVILRGMNDETKVATLAALGFQARVQSVILPLLGTSEAIKQYEKGLRRVGGTTTEVAARQMKSFSSQMKIFWNQMRVVGIEIGRTLAPMINQLTSLIRDGLATWQRYSAETKKTWVVVGLLVAGIGPLLIVFGSLISLVGFTIQAFGAMATATGAVSAKAVALKFAWGGLIGLGVILFLGAMRAAMVEVNAELRKSVDMLDRLSRSQLEHIGALSGAARAEAVWEEGLRRSLAVREAQQRLELERRRLIALPEYKKLSIALGTIVRFTTGGLIGPEDPLKPYKDQIKAAERRLREFSDFRKRLRTEEQTDWQKTAEVARQVAQRTMAQEHQRRRALTKALAEQKDALEGHRKTLEAGRRIIEQFLTPQEKFTKRWRELSGLLDVGAIGMTTFNRAMEAANKELDNAQKKSKVKVEFSVEGLPAIRAGSAEMALLIAESRRAMAAVPQVRAPARRRMWWEMQPHVAAGERAREDRGLQALDRNTALLDRIAASMERLIAIEEEELDRPAIELEEAGLEG